MLMNVKEIMPLWESDMKYRAMFNLQNAYSIHCSRTISAVVCGTLSKYVAFI